ETRAGVRASRAVAVQVHGRIDHQLGPLGHGKVQIQARGEEPLVGQAAERILERQRLIVPCYAHAEDGGCSPLVRAVKPETFLAADQVEVDEAAERRVPVWRDATPAAGRAGSRRLIDRRVSLVNATSEADLLVEGPASHLHAEVAKGRKGAVGKPEPVGLQVGCDEVGGVYQHMTRDRFVQQARVDVDDGSSVDPRRSPADPRVLQADAPCEVAELSEVRVVELEEVADVLADVAVEIHSGSPEEQVVARVHPIRSTGLVDDELGLELEVQVERRLFGAEGHADRVRRGGREKKSQAENGLRGTFHRDPLLESSNSGCSRYAKQQRLPSTGSARTRAPARAGQDQRER